MMKDIFISIFLISVAAFCATASASVLSESTVSIYVEDNNGGRIATGNGIVLSEEGLIATDMHLLLSWLETDGNSLFVRTAESGYYPLKSLFSIKRDLGVAFFEIKASDMKPATLPSDGMPVPGEDISIVTDIGRRDQVSTEGVVAGIGEGGFLELSVEANDTFRGAPVLNSRGEIIGMFLKKDGKDLAIPLMLAQEYAEQEMTNAQDAPLPNNSGIKKAQAAVQSSRATAKDYLHLGAVYAKSDMPELAITAFMKSIELKPDYPEAYHGLGVAYAGQKMYDEAVEALKNAVKYNPRYAKAFANLGFLYDYLGNPEEATAAFSNAIAIRPEYAEAHNGLGVAYARGHNYADAINSFKQALRFKPEFKDARFNLALSYISLGQKEAALREEAALRGIDPEMADRLMELIKVDDEPEETAEGVEDTNAHEDDGEEAILPSGDG